MAQYLKKDCEQGFVTDNTEIEYLKLNNMRHTVLGCMLGDFDVQGNYVVADDIVKELIAMPKYIVDTVDNVDVCSSVLKLDKQITFFVTYEGESVTLTLAEKVNFQANYKINSGLFCNINEFVLDRVETSGVVDKNLIYKRWNISPFTGKALDVFDMDEQTLAMYAAIVNRFKYIMKANQTLLENENELEEIEAKYATDMLEVISHYPELKKVVDAKIKDIVLNNKGMLKTDKPFFAKTVNEVITQTVEQNHDVLNEQQKAEFEAERHNATLERNIKISQAIETSTVPILDDKGEVVTSKYILNTFGEERNLSVKEVAAEYVDAKSKTTQQVVARAAAESLPEKEKEEFSIANSLLSFKQRNVLVDKLAAITGLTLIEFGKAVTDKVTQTAVETVMAKSASAKVEQQPTNLVAATAEQTAKKQTSPDKPAKATNKAKSTKTNKGTTTKTKADTKQTNGATTPTTTKKTTYNPFDIGSTKGTAIRGESEKSLIGAVAANAEQTKTEQLSSDIDKEIEDSLFNFWDNKESTNPDLEKTVEDTFKNMEGSTEPLIGDMVQEEQNSESVQQI